MMYNVKWATALGLMGHLKSFCHLTKKIQFGQHFSNKEGVQKDKWKIRLPKKPLPIPLLMS